MEAWKEEMLMHAGTKGMRWHVRRYRNEDGTLTEAGRRRYGVGPARDDSPAALISRPDLAKRSFKTSSNAKHLVSTDNLISDTKKLLGEPSENEKLTEQFLRDANGRKVSMDDLVDGLPKTENLPALYNPSKKTNDFFEEKGLVIRKSEPQNISDDYEEVDNDAPGGIAKPTTFIVGEGKSRRGEKNGKVVDADYEEVNDAPKASRKPEQKNARNEKQDNKSEPKKSDDDTVKVVDADYEEVNDAPKASRKPEQKNARSAPENKTMTKEEREERRKSLALKGAAAKTLTNESKNILDNTNSVYSMLKKTSRMNSIDYSKMTNDDLRKQTERLNLERNYREAVGNNVGNRERRVNAFLSTTGSALAVAGSAIGIAIAIKQLRNG